MRTLSAALTTHQGDLQRKVSVVNAQSFKIPHEFLDCPLQSVVYLQYSSLAARSSRKATGAVV